MGQGQYSDCSLPSRDELNEMCIQRAPIGSLASIPGAVHWSSSESGSGVQWAQDIGDGVQFDGNKIASYMLRGLSGYESTQPPSGFASNALSDSWWAFGYIASRYVPGWFWARVGGSGWRRTTEQRGRTVVAVAVVPLLATVTGCPEGSLLGLVDGDSELGTDARLGCSEDSC